MIDKPFVHLFETPLGYYLYDVNQNNVIEISSSLYNKLSTPNEMDANDVSAPLVNGILQSNQRKCVVQEDLKYVADLCLHHLDTLLLQVTQECNFRCDYCVYSGNYENRIHRHKSMTWETARQSIDYFLEHSSDCKTLYVGFYGGEPLLEFPLIKKCIEYIEGKSKKEIYFNITTNGSLLFPEVATYFTNHNVAIMFSIDGPKEVHDSKRKYAQTHKGTFEDVRKNIAWLAKTYPDFYEDDVHYNVVIHENGFKAVDDFFKTDPLFKDSLVTANFITDNYSKTSTALDKKDYCEYRYQEFLTWLSKLGRIKSNPSKLTNQAFEKISEVPNRFGGCDCVDGVCYRSGNCIPGVQKLFITVDGDFYPCERVNEATETTRIGSLKHGIDVNKVIELANLATYTQAACLQCWARNFCEICLSGLDEKDGIHSENILKRCEKLRGSTDELLKNYVTLQRLGYNFHKEDDEVIESYNFHFHTDAEINENPILYDVETPVVYFTELYPDLITAELRTSMIDSIEACGYEVAILSTGDLSDSIHQQENISYIWYESNGFSEKIIDLNHAIKKIEQQWKPDLILIEIPGGLTSCSTEVVSHYGVELQIAKAAAPSDCTVVNIPFEEYSTSDLNKLKSSVKGIHSVEIDLMNIQPLKIRMEESKRYHFMSYLTINDSALIKIKNALDDRELNVPVTLQSNLGENVLNVLRNNNQGGNHNE